jgi:OOP family OmpA-OmpF porin
MSQAIGMIAPALPSLFTTPAPAPAPAPAPKCVAQMDTITIGAAKLFGYDKSNISAEGKAALDEAAAKINANSDITLVVVTGHTDRTGSFGYNQKLSERRAKQVGQYLVTQGVNSSLISTTGRGESVPVKMCKGTKATKALISCLAPNRRVEIRAETKKEVGCI